MEIYPAIDLRSGRVVRMRRGQTTRHTLYHPDPLAVADAFAADGARWLHIVDLDHVVGAGRQTALLRALVERVPMRVQVGGGLVTEAEVAEALGSGARRVVLGMLAAAAPGLLAAHVARFGAERLGLAVDVRGGRAQLGHGVDGAELTAAEVAGRAAAAEIGMVTYTDLRREGKLGGADVEGAAAVWRETGVEVVVSGGVRSLEEIARIRDAGLAGAVVGRALFEGRFTLREALACSSSSPS